MQKSGKSAVCMRRQNCGRACWNKPSRGSGNWSGRPDSNPNGWVSHKRIIQSPVAVKPKDMKGFTIWLTGMSGSGKTTLAELLARRLRACQAPVEILDGDLVRRSLCRGLGFTREDRDENVHRIGFVCEIGRAHV